MSSTRALSFGVSVCFLLVVSSAFPPTARAAWVNSTKAQFQVGGQLHQITPAAASPFIDPTCDSQGGTSLALVQGRKLAGVDAVMNPLVLVVSCLSSNAANAARLSFISPTDGKVVKQISTTPVPGNGWAHLVLRPDKGDLLGCGNNGALYSIDFSQDTSTPDGTATPLPIPSQSTSCNGLAWDAEADMIYVGLNAGPGIGRVVRFKDGTTTLLGDFTNLPCGANGLAISGGGLAHVMRGRPHPPPEGQEYRAEPRSQRNTYHHPGDLHQPRTRPRRPRVRPRDVPQGCDRKGPVHGRAVVPAGRQR
jgi:hypothetical protein